MMRVYYDRDADVNLVKSRKVAVIGYGSQGHAHANNLRDSGVKEVVVALRPGSASIQKAENAGLKVMTNVEAAKWADIVMVLAPDELQAGLYSGELRPNMRQGSALAVAFLEEYLARLHNIAGDRPLLITENDYELGLYNGDTGVIVQSDPGHATAVFERGEELMSFSPLRLSGVETVYAMTIHKSQGSQFDTAAVLLPPADSPIVTRELLYTAVTRARKRLILVAGEDTVRAAVGRPVSRASGLRERLWGS